jgi:hypothetical protein
MRKLNDEQIKWILTSSVSGVKKAKELGCSRELIRQVVMGKSYAKVHPEISRKSAQIISGATSCYRCTHWIKASAAKAEEGRCEIGFPESAIEGPGFAKECNAFVSNRKTKPIEAS